MILLAKARKEEGIHMNKTSLLFERSAMLVDIRKSQVRKTLNSSSLDHKFITVGGIFEVPQNPAAMRALLV